MDVGMSGSDGERTVVFKLDSSKFSAASSFY